MLQKKKSVKEQVKIVTSQRCKQSVMQFNARYVAINMLTCIHNNNYNSCIIKLILHTATVTVYYFMQ